MTSELGCCAFIASLRFKQSIDSSSESSPLSDETIESGLSFVRDPIIATRRARIGFTPEGRDELLLAQPSEERIDGPLACDETICCGQCSHQLEAIAFAVPKQRKDAVLKGASAELRYVVLCLTWYHALHSTRNSARRQVHGRRRSYLLQQSLPRCTESTRAGDGLLPDIRASHHLVAGSAQNGAKSPRLVALSTF